MAVTKIHPIKSTLKKALDYIENPDKTDGKLFVSSYGCSYETADIEFQMLLDQAYQKGNNLAHHLIQAFEPGETTAEQAHEIGRQLADEVLQGKYPYVITTHIDKGHLHNHIIFCAVDMANQRKYISNRQTYAFIRRTSDRLCKEYGLSVVKPGKDKGKTYAEWDAQKKGKSWKAKLKIAIDAAIPQAKDFDSFLRLMEAQGYEVKQGKFISFRALADGLRPVCFKFEGIAYKITIEDVKLFPQGYSAIALHPELIQNEPSVLLMDIGGWTVDLMRLDNGIPNAATCRSLELGMIRCLDEIGEQIRRALGLSMTAAQMESVLRGDAVHINADARKIIDRQADAYVHRLLSAITESGLDTRAMPAVFLGGGAALLKRNVSAADGLCRPVILDDVSLNAKGYERLAERLTKNDEQ